MLNPFFLITVLCIMLLVLLLVSPIVLADQLSCTGGVFEYHNVTKDFNTNCDIGAQNCSAWFVFTVVATNNETISENFARTIDNMTQYCTKCNVSFMSLQKFHDDPSCEFEVKSPSYFYDQATKYKVSPAGSSYTADDAARMLNHVANCSIVTPAANVGGVIYVYIDISCAEACASGLLIDYQGRFVAVANRMKYWVQIYYVSTGETCYDTIFQQCHNTDHCAMTSNAFPTKELCPVPTGVILTQFELIFSVAIVAFLLFVIVFINVVLICQKQNRVREAYEMLRKKHFPISNDYVTDPRKARVTDEWEIDTEHLDVYVNTILGTGAFAIVYKGKLNGRRPVDDIIQTIQLKSSISDEVAIKRPPPHSDSSAKNDFMEEINFMKSLGYHVHILGMIGCITTTETPMIVMPFCEQGDLLQFLHQNRETFTDKEGPIRAKELLSISWQISDGLCYLKSLDLIHRDLAARNILLTSDFTAKISDFGLCRKGEITDANSVYISKGGRLPVKWMAPEALKEYIFSFSSDVWAFGVVLWETFSIGESPFAAVNGGAIYEILESGERLEKLPIIPADLYELMEQCWKWNPDDRLTIEEIHMELQEHLSNSSLYYGYLTMPRLDSDSEEESAS